MEFLIVVVAALFFLVMFIGVIYLNIGYNQAEKEKKEVRYIALSIKEEIDIAYKTTDGYRREFYVPEKILGKDYELKMENQHIYVLTDKHSASYRIQNVTGNIQKGENFIKKENGKIYLNK